jgi:UPF0755 protein
VTDLFDAPTLQRTAPNRTSRSAASKRAAAKRRRRRRQRTTAIIALVVIALGGAAFVLWDKMGSSLLNFSFANQAEDYPGPGTDPVEVEIPEGATGAQMGTVLHDAGVVASVEAFNDAFAANPAASGIQPGTYQLLTEMKASDAVTRLIENEKIQTSVTIPEGFTAAQVVDRVASVTEISADDLQAALDKPKSIGLPAAAEGNVEGWLFPKTYSVQPGDDATTLLKSMVGQTISELESLGVPKDEWQETLIKASLIEREAKSDADRPKMARAIENRLERDTTLGIDAAIAYGLGKSGLDLTVDDLQDTENPYNLRVHLGLPPGPIANPGAASVDAVVHPADGNWMFWITVNLDTGETKFSETYEQHKIYEQELRAWEAENGG